jgi:hypothetical protein
MRSSLVLLALVAGCGGAAQGPSTFSAIDQQIFKISCEFSSCHSKAGANAAGHMNLMDGAYAALVGVPADNAQAKSEGKLRVKPGDSANSMLFIKLNIAPVNDPSTGVSCEQQNPVVGYGGCMPQSNAPLDSGTIAGIKKWIDGGALNN